MAETLLQPADCLFLFVDYQAGLAFGVESIARQAIVNNAISLARTAMVFNAPIVASTSASKVYSGPLVPSLQAVMPSVKPIERRNMNAWEAYIGFLLSNRLVVADADVFRDCFVELPLEHVTIVPVDGASAAVLSPLETMRTISSCCCDDNLSRRPPIRPSRRAESKPAFVRSRSMALSNSANCGSPPP
jgi:hypothetical protein